MRALASAPAAAQAGALHDGRLAACSIWANNVQLGTIHAAICS